MYESKLASLINEAINDCINNGVGERKIKSSNIRIYADWQSLENDEKYDVVTVTFDTIKLGTGLFDYQELDTKKKHE